MSMRTALAACAGALLTLSAFAAPAQAQMLELDPNQPQWGLNRHQVRVVQFALRDANCYEGRIDGVVGPATRRALECARQQVGSAQPTDPTFTQGLALYRASAVGGDATMQREAAGEIETPTRPAQPPQVMPTQPPTTPTTPVTPTLTPTPTDTLRTPTDTMRTPRDTLRTPTDSLPTQDPPPQTPVPVPYF